jgi:hypothetical protein
MNEKPMIEHREFLTKSHIGFDPNLQNLINQQNQNNNEN